VKHEGEIAYDLLLSETDPNLVSFEIDCGWMTVAGYSPARYLREHPSRFVMLHIKDFLPVSNSHQPVDPDSCVSVELGNGFIDYEPIFQAAREARIRHYFVEQEGPFTRMPSLQAARV